MSYKSRSGWTVGINICKCGNVIYEGGKTCEQCKEAKTEQSSKSN